jgi:hypothetical protein
MKKIILFLMLAIAFTSCSTQKSLQNGLHSNIGLLANKNDAEIPYVYSSKTGLHNHNY